MKTGCGDEKHGSIDPRKIAQYTKNEAYPQSGICFIEQGK
jgi:hypothetical protein